MRKQVDERLLTGVEQWARLLSLVALCTTLITAIRFFDKAMMIEADLCLRYGKELYDVIYGVIEAAGEE